MRTIRFHLTLLMMLIMLFISLPALPVAAHSALRTVVIYPAGIRASIPTGNPTRIPTSTFPHQTQQLIVKFSDQTQSGASAAALTARLSALRKASGRALSYVRTMGTGAQVLRLADAVGTSEIEQVVQSLRANAAALGIEYVEPDRIVVPFLVPNDPGYTQQWNLSAVGGGTFGSNLPAAWSITTGSSSTVVAIIDTGIRPDHPEFAGRLLPGYDFIWDPYVSNDGDGQDDDPADPGDWVTADEANSDAYRGCPVRASSWHGTHVTGIMAATGNNGIGMAGINWKTKILPVRALGKCGGYISDIADGILWAAGYPVVGAPVNPTPAQVINLSLGSPRACSASEQSAISTAILLGATVVAAAGNSNTDVSGQAPANCDGVIAVAATDRYGNRAVYSNHGSRVTISAPGGGSDGIFSTLALGAQSPQGPGYGYKTGTSTAAPHVAGIVSLMLAVNPLLTPAEIATLLRSSATAFPAGSTCTPSLCGAGIVNAAAAVSAARPSSGGVIGPIIGPILSPILTALPLLPPPATPTPLPTTKPMQTAIPTATPTATTSRTPNPTPTSGPTATETPGPASTSTSMSNPLPIPGGTVRPPAHTEEEYVFQWVGDHIEVQWVSATGTRATLEYGTQPGVYPSRASETHFQQTHALPLPDMVPGPLYYFIITEVDTAGQQYVTTELTIRMPALHATYLPLLVE